MENYMTLNTLQLCADLKNSNYVELLNHAYAGFPLQLLYCNNELIRQIHLPNKHILVQRLYQGALPEGIESINLVKKTENKIQLTFPVAVGAIRILLYVDVPEAESFILNTSIYLDCQKEHIHHQEHREVLVLTSDYNLPNAPTEYVEQVEGRSGHCFVDFGKRTIGSLLYFQDLGATQHIAEQTQVSYLDTVKVEWPQLGFKFPRTKQLLHQGDSYCIQQAFIGYHNKKPHTPQQASEFYLRLLYHIYPTLQKPEKKIRDVLECATKTLQDLSQHKGCWKQVQDAAFLNAYVNSYETPESMVQLAILKPLFEYHQQFDFPWSEHIIGELTKNIARFYDKELGIIHRWLPADSYLLDFEEEQKRSFIMDSWYLLYPLLQLASLFEQGLKDDVLEEQFQKSLLYIRKAAKSFDYDWPIFFNLYTLEILKNEGNHDVFGEIDTAGLYIQIMLKSYKLYNKEVYLSEAKRAASKLKSVDLNSLYQSNNAAYSAEALLELYGLIPNNKYLEIAEVFLGNIIRNCAIWDMKYGNAKERESFFALFPLQKTLYTAAFEEHETVAIFNRIVQLVHGKKIPLSPYVQFFINEYIQYALIRLHYYFPPFLPTDIFADEAKTGYVNTTIYIPIEDLGDGWEAIGQIGQEVYGASVFLNLCIHHVVILEENMYAISSLPFVQNRKNKLDILGAPEQKGILWIKDNENNAIAIEINKERQQSNTEYIIKANDTVKFILK
jgi:hypothetical protein